MDVCVSVTLYVMECLTIFVIIILPIIALKLYVLLTNSHCKSNVCLIGKTALVTGGNSGVGYGTVLALASRGCRVIIADKVKDPDLEERIFKETHSTNVVYKYVDLASFESVRELAKDIVKSEKLDILINNAGIGRTRTIVTNDGLDVTMQVNYFSAFLLTHLLVDLLKKSSGRVIFTSSCASFFNNLSLDCLRPQKKCPALNYANSKLCYIIAADIFAQKLKKYNVTSNSYHPGFVYTNIFKEVSKHAIKFNAGLVIAKLTEVISLLFGKTPQEGAQTAIYLACANEVENVTGQYFSETVSTFKPKKAYDEKFCQAVWKASEEIVKLESNEKL